MGMQIPFEKMTDDALAGLMKDGLSNIGSRWDECVANNAKMARDEFFRRQRVLPRAEKEARNG